MAEPIDFAATIASLQEQIDTLNGELAGHRKLIDTGDIDAFWLLFGGVLVFWMQAGFAMLEVGSVSKKNTKNILVKNIFDACIAAMMWWAIGSSLAGGTGDDFTSDGSNGFAGNGALFLSTSTGNKSAYAKASWFFGWTFAGAGCTIVSGAIAERATFTAYAIYSVVLTGFVYPPVVHMMWGAGRFSAWRSLSSRPHNDDADDASAGRLFGDCGVIDFAGSGTVHMTGGVAAIIAAKFMGTRKKGFPDNLPEGQPVYQALGIFILWMGCPPPTSPSRRRSAPRPGCLSTSAIGYAIFHYIDPGYVYNGVLAGLVGITSPCAVVSPAGAVIIGALAGPVYVAASTAVKKAGIDDAVDAFAVHGACGMWGVIAAGLFATPYYYEVSYYSDRKDDCAGIFYGGKATGSFAAGFACIGVILAWVGSTMTILFGTLSATGQLRVTAEVEATGLDDSKHGGAISDVKVEDIVAKGEGIGGGTVVIPSAA
ncbi:ammonium transmembrane transporter [Aureococcus anophagefferens]|nr:ammonium transmembrane transporter [Aureococcus anophagefferens]